MAAFRPFCFDRACPRNPYGRAPWDRFSGPGRPPPRPCRTASNRNRPALVRSTASPHFSPSFSASARSRIAAAALMPTFAAPRASIARAEFGSSRKAAFASASASAHCHVSTRRNARANVRGRRLRLRGRLRLGRNRWKRQPDHPCQQERPAAWIDAHGKRPLFVASRECK